MNIRFNWDALGVATSVACAIHCAILPLVLQSLPIFGVNIIDNIGFEYFMIFLAFAIGWYSLWHGYKKHHHKKAPLIMLSMGMLFLLAKQVWHNWQYVFLPIALLLIVTAHVLNYRSCRAHDQGHDDDCDH